MEVRRKLALLIEAIWQGDVSYKEAVKGFTSKQLDEMEQAIENYPNVYTKDGVPFIEDIVESELVEFSDSRSNGVLLIQVMINNNE